MYKRILTAISIAFISLPQLRSQDIELLKQIDIEDISLCGAAFSNELSTAGLDLAFSDYNYEFRFDSVKMNVTVINQGDEDLTSYALCGLYYSVDTVYQLEDPKIYHMGIYGLAVQAEESFSFQIHLNRFYEYPYLLLVVDGTDSIPEIDETNNIKVIDIPAPTLTDLALAMNYYEAFIGAGDSILVTTDIVNNGRIKSNTSEIIYYLSEDIFLDNSDELLYTANIPAIEAWTSISHSQKMQIPSSMKEGYYYLLVKLDYPDDLNKNNNLGRARYLIDAAEPEQNLYDLTLAVPFGVINCVVGDTIEISYTIENLRDSTPGSTVVSYFLSNDEYINSQDILLGTKELSAMDKGESKVMLDTLNIPLNILPGTYGIIISIGENNSFIETDIKNNIALIYCFIKATGISNEWISGPGIQLYPNPASAIIQIKSGRELNSYKIFNNQGQTVSSATLHGLHNARIDVEALKPGIYYIRVTSGKFVETEIFEVTK